MDKVVEDRAAAASVVADGMTVVIGGFGGAGAPIELIHGGAIALGHPRGMSGARITGTAALELSWRGKRRALATMCIGVGQGIAIGLETP